MTDYFALFGLPAGFEIDGAALSQRYRDLQRTVHPDRFANASSRERLLSVQQAAQINEGYHVLRDPLLRARHLLEQDGIELSETDTQMDPAFLMEQMELREALAAASGADDPYAVLDDIRRKAEDSQRTLLDGVAALFRQGGEASGQIPEQLRRLQFMRKLLDEVDQQEDELAQDA